MFFKLSRRASALIAAFFVLSADSSAFAQSTKAQLNSSINSNFPDNTTNAITPQNLRTVAAGIVNSIMPTAPVTAGNLACFDGTTGLLKDCAGSSGFTIGGPLTIDPTASTTNQGLVINQTLPFGSQSSGPYSGSLSTITNSGYTSTASGFSTTTGLLNALVAGQRIDYLSAGSGPGQGPIQIGGMVTSAETSQGQQLIGFHASAATNIASAGNDDIWGFTGYAYVGPSANLASAHAVEAQSGIRSGAVVANRDGVSIVSIGDAAASTIDSAITISSQPSPYAASPVPFTNGITFWTPGGTPPIATTGSALTANSAFTMANFANFPSSTVSGNILNFQNAVIAGSGAAVFGGGSGSLVANTVTSLLPAIIQSGSAGALRVGPSTGNALVVDGSAGSLVNGVGVVGAATASPPQINSVSGSSTNVGMLLQTKGTGQFTFGNYTAATVQVNVGNPGSVTGSLLITPTVVNSLPTCNSGADGLRAFVTNNNTAVSFGGAVTTGGTTHSPVYCDGSASAWKQG